MAGFTVLLSDERSPDFGHLGSLGLVEHHQQDHPSAWGEPVGDSHLLALKVEPKLADLAPQVARIQLAECLGVVGRRSAYNSARP
jgi:hypothetical protein